MLRSKGERRFSCGACNQRFVDIEAARRHASTRHRKLECVWIFQRSELHKNPPIAAREPSIAERMIDAELDHACGIPLDADQEGLLSWKD